MLSCTHEAILHNPYRACAAHVCVCVEQKVRDVVPRYKPVMIRVLQCYRVHTQRFHISPRALPLVIYEITSCVYTITQ